MLVEPASGFDCGVDDGDCQAALRTVLDHCSLFALTRGLKILEVGTGSGRLAVAICQAIPDAEVVGCDMDEAALLRATARIAGAQSLNGMAVSDRITLHHGALESALRASSATKFDVVLLKDVYGRMSEGERDVLISNVRSILNVGGIVVLLDQLSPLQTTACGLWDVVLSRGPTLGGTCKPDGISAQRLETWVKQTFGPSSIGGAAIVGSHEIGTSSRFEIVIHFEELLPEHKFSPADFTFQLSKPFGSILLEGHTYGAVSGSLNLFVARSGGGKTTFLRALQGDLRGFLSKRRLAAGTNLFSMPQDPDIFASLSPIQNVRAFGGEVEDATRVLRELGLGESFFARRDCEGISGGERQRLVLAQALTATPELLLLDEPSRGLDRARRLLLFEALMTSRRTSGPRSMTIACTDHDIKATYDLFDFVFEFINGRQVLVWSNPNHLAC